MTSRNESSPTDEAVDGRDVLLVGGGGYVGTQLTRHLLDRGAKVTVLDTFWFGDFLGDHPNLCKIQADVRDRKTVQDACEGKDMLVLLACLSNDPMSDIDPGLTRAINRDALVGVIETAKAAGIHRCVYASSSSVYGIQDVPKVTEDIELKPITLYSRYKAEIEAVLNAVASPYFTVVSIRSATVCGYSPRMRLDLLVNLFVYLAIKNGIIYVEGGKQIRPLIHIADLIDFYTLLLTLPDDAVQRQVFNVSAGNFTVLDIAELTCKHIPCEIKYAEVVDQRSYPLCSDRACDVLGFRTQRTIEQALLEVKDAIDSKQIDVDDLRCFNLKYLQHLMQSGVNIREV